MLRFVLPNILTDEFFVLLSYLTDVVIRIFFGNNHAEISASKINCDGQQNV